MLVVILTSCFCEEAGLYSYTGFEGVIEFPHAMQWDQFGHGRTPAEWSSSWMEEQTSMFEEEVEAHVQETFNKLPTETLLARVPSANRKQIEKKYRDTHGPITFMDWICKTFGGKKIFSVDDQTVSTLILAGLNSQLHVPHPDDPEFSVLALNV